MRPAECLEGLDLQGGWHVDSILHRPATSTGGNFSVGYRVTGPNGKQAYLKALDFSIAFSQPDFPRVLEALTSAYNFERNVLEKCKNRKLDRVVTPLADGNTQVPGNFGPLGNVSYLIFELARGDIRAEVTSWQQFDLAWVLRSLHHTSTGLAQLHSAQIAHQDLKPSNILVFQEEGSKIADLGRASDMEKPSQVDRLQIPGDIGYAAPEQAYGWQLSPTFDSRYVADLYLLGNLLFFYFMTTSATAAIQLKLRQLQPAFSRTEFLQDLPYLQEAFSEVIADLERILLPLADDLTPEVIMIARQLCEPDPRRRGDPNAVMTGRPQHDVHGYISRFDRLAGRAEWRLR